jgi:heterodisulfide reductase subunit A
MSAKHIGVFICECGDRIASTLDVASIAEHLAEGGGLKVAEVLPYACSPGGVEFIAGRCSAEDLDGIVVAGCSPRAMEGHFRGAFEHKGLPDLEVEITNIRDCCAMVHRQDRAAANRKAHEMVRMAVAKLAVRPPRASVERRVSQQALVLGGGVAGITAALALAREDIPVKLVERGKDIGISLDHPWEGVLRENVGEDLRAKASEVRGNRSIELFLSSQVESVSGGPGHYQVAVKRGGRDPCSTTIEAGAIIVATGAQTLCPVGMLGYDGERVVTQVEFARALERFRADDGARRIPQDVVVILCASQRDEGHPYCSFGCCEAALKQWKEMRALGGGARLTILYRDLFLPESRAESRLQEALESGVRFVHYSPNRSPQVHSHAVKYFDPARDAWTEIPYDQVVLATPLVPHDDARFIASVFHLPLDENGFYMQPEFRLRPGSYSERGVYVCGAARSPASFVDMELQALVAAYRAKRCVQAEAIYRRPFIGAIDQSLCSGCGSCISSCPNGAISMRSGTGLLDIATVDPFLCNGCGSCVVSCPTKAIDLLVDSEAEIQARINQALPDGGSNSRPRVIFFGCDWSGYAAAELAGAKGLSYSPSIRPIRVGCSARVDAKHVLWALNTGADGVLVGACPPGACHHGDGNLRAHERFSRLVGQLSGVGFDTRRLRFRWVSPDDADGLASELDAFSELIGKLGIFRPGGSDLA